MGWTQRKREKGCAKRWASQSKSDGGKGELQLRSFCKCLATTSCTSNLTCGPSALAKTNGPPTPIIRKIGSPWGLSNVLSYWHTFINRHRKRTTEEKQQKRRETATMTQMKNDEGVRVWYTFSEHLSFSCVPLVEQVMEVRSTIMGSQHP